MNLNGVKFVIVGSGFYGSVLAERIANDLNEKVVIIEKRSHIGGNSYSFIDDETNIEVHKYGSHIFHTSNIKVWNYITKFSAFNDYKHRVLTTHKGLVYSMPINLFTINQLYKLNLKSYEAKDFIYKEIRKEKLESPNNFEEMAISLIGRPLYEAFIKGYTFKQWECSPNKLPKEIITRLPVRFNYNDRYFSDTYEGIPVDGYDKLFSRMLNSKNISIKFDVDFFELKKQLPKDALVIYSGPIDRYFDYKFGELNWRTLEFKKEVYNVEDYQGTSVMNYADRTDPFTRIHEFKHFKIKEFGELKKTVIYKEFSKEAKKHDTPYYPVNSIQDQSTFKLYQEELKKYPNLIIGGRLGEYKYMDMHHTIASALKTYEEKIIPRFKSKGSLSPKLENNNHLIKENYA